MTVNVDEDVGQEQPSYSVGENVNSAATMEVSAEVPQKAKNRTNI